jgi:hypothetical protein
MPDGLRSIEPSLDWRYLADRFLRRDDRISAELNREAIDIPIDRPSGLFAIVCQIVTPMVMDIDRDATRTTEASPRLRTALLHTLPLMKLRWFNSAIVACTASASPLSEILMCFVLHFIWGFLL